MSGLHEALTTNILMGHEKTVTGLSVGPPKTGTPLDLLLAFA